MSSHSGGFSTSSRFAPPERPAASASSVHYGRRRSSSSSDAASSPSPSAPAPSAGLPLLTARTRLLSESSRGRLRTAERGEYLEVTRRRVLPKLMELAGRLVPAAAAELGRGGGDGDADADASRGGGFEGETDGGGLVCAWGHDDYEADPRGSVGSGRFKTTGLDGCESTGGGGGSLNPESARRGYDFQCGGDPPLVSPLASPFPTGRDRHRLCLPQSAAMLAAGLQPPSLSEEDDGGGSPAATSALSPGSAGGRGAAVPVEAIAASLRSDVALLDYEADALLVSLREGGGGDGGGARISPPQSRSPATATMPTQSSTARRRATSVDSDGVSVASYDMSDDDGMGGEIRRLGDVVDSLRRDLEGADLGVALRGSAECDDGGDDGAEGDAAASDAAASSSRGDALYGSDGWGGGDAGRRRRRTSQLAMQLQTWKYFGLRNGADGGAGSSSSALYWAVALVWAVVILLAGHLKLRQTIGADEDGSFENWADVLGWLFSG